MADSFVNDTGLGRIWGKIKEALAGKAPLSHTHTKNQITDFPTSMPASDVYEWAKASSKPSYGISEISGLQSALDGKEVTSNKVTSWSSTTTDAHYPSEKLVKAGLDGKANSSHTHSISQINSLQATLDGKANSSHTHSISQITDFPTSMPASDVYEWAKASSKPSYNTSEISGLQSALDGKANSSHTHSISQINSLQATLDGKANSSHTHSISQITNLQSTLDGKANKTHSHNYQQKIICESHSSTNLIIYTIKSMNVSALKMLDITLNKNNDDFSCEIIIPSGGTYLISFTSSIGISLDSHTSRNHDAVVAGGTKLETGENGSFKLVGFIYRIS